MAEDHPSITCPVCKMTSYHPKDIEHGYCGNCHDYTTPVRRGPGDPVTEKSPDGRVEP